MKRSSGQTGFSRIEKLRPLRPEKFIFELGGFYLDCNIVIIIKRKEKKV